jgi:protein-disulfide isomerase
METQIHRKTVFGFAAMAAMAFLLLTACPSRDPENPADPGEPVVSGTQDVREQLAEQKQLLEEIKNDVSEVKSDIKEIVKAVAEARRPPAEDQERQVSIDDDSIRGRQNAKLTLIEFSDFQCPYCARFYKETLPHIEREYIQTGKVRMVYRDFPLDNIHQDAQKAAEASQCAGDQGKFWEMHDKLFENNQALGATDLKKYAGQLGLSQDRFDTCLDSGQYADEVRKDLMDGQAAGVQGTPTFFLGYTGKGKTLQAVPIRGARPYPAFKQIFDKMLQEK